ELMEVRRLFLSDMIKLFSNSRENRRCLLQCSVWQDWMFSLGYINPKNPEEQKITEMVYNIFRILLYHAIKYEWGGWRVWVDTLSIAHSKVTYEAHKEYLAKMYEEYQRQEEENIKKGKKGSVSTISGLSAQPAAVNGNMEIREMDDTSQTQTPESEADYGEGGDSRNLLAEGKGPEAEPERTGSGVRVEVHDLLVDIKAEKVEATEVKLDDLDLSPEALGGGGGMENGPLVEVDSLLDSAYCAAVRKLNGGLGPKEEEEVGIVGLGEDSNLGPLITLADEKDSVPSNNGFLSFPKADEKLLPSLAPAEPLTLTGRDKPPCASSASDDLSLLAHMTSCGADLGPSHGGTLPEDEGFKLQDSLADISRLAEAEAQAQAQAAAAGTDGHEAGAGDGATAKSGDAVSTTSDTERSDDGKDKEMKKIQTTATTQVQTCLKNRIERDLRVDLGFRGMPMTEEQRRQFSPGPRTTMFRIPEFKWSPMHQRLLTDLLFALETDVHVWRSHSTKSVMDFVNSNENIIFVHNTIHLISQMVDNIIIACGGILPLLSAATSPSVSGTTTELENVEATQGMSSETAVTFLSRLMAMVDVLVFASSLNFSEIEAEKNMSSGGLMRQCLRLVCCVAVRNCLECRQRQRDRGSKSSLPISKTQENLQSAASATNVPRNLSPIKDPDRLLQDVDINRLRAVVFRDVDDSKQAQFLALAVVYFISVLMVSKYRDILEPQREIGRSSSLSGRSIRQEINSPTSTENPSSFSDSGRGERPLDELPLEGSLPHTDSGIGDEQVGGALNVSELGGEASGGSTGSGGGPDAMSELLCTLSSEVRKSRESLLESPPGVDIHLKPAASISSISQANKGINVKEILKSLVAAPVKGAEVGPEPQPYHPDPALKRETAAMLPMQFHSFDRSVVVPVKKPPPGSLAVNTVGTPTTCAVPSSGSTPNIFAAATATPKSMINTTGATDSASSSSSSSSFVNGATSKNLPAVQTVAPMPEDTVENMSITTKLERALEKVAPLLREIFVDFAPFLSRTLLGSHGQELLIEGLVCMKSSTSVVELVMLLCSQVRLTLELKMSEITKKNMQSFWTSNNAKKTKKIINIWWNNPVFDHSFHGWHHVLLHQSYTLLLDNFMLLYSWCKNSSSSAWWFDASVMFNFPDQATVKKVVYSLPRVGVGTSYGLPQARRISLATPRQLFKSSNMTQRWQRREISNFEYLMFLNTIAGDVYRFVLISVVCSVARPICCLKPKKRLNANVSNEPFTTFYLNGNEKKFDHPDRTFSGIMRSWRSCQRDTSDVKELIPEFYYLPEMFVNSNGYDLGLREDRSAVSDVELPVWAKKPEDFVRINRMALESEFVSCQLHQWIDLIFGYKQRGPEAVRALNVFHYMSYEGSVNLDTITDLQLRESMEAQIQTFGQVPSQLLIEPHPPRSSAMHLCFLPQSPLMFKDQMQQDVIMVLKFPSNSPVTHVAANTLPHLSVPAAVTVTCSRLFAVNRWHNTVGLRGAPGYSLEQAHHLPIEMDPLIANNSGVNKRQITDLVDQSIQINTHCFVVTADNRYILVCGFWDKSFRVYSTETGVFWVFVCACLCLGDYPAPRAVLTGHDHEVVCVSVCAELGLVISGAKGHGWSLLTVCVCVCVCVCVSQAILLSSDGQNLVTGGDNGVVEVWQACDFKQLYIYPGCDAGIRAMDLSHDQRTLITGMASGSIVAFNIDFNRWHYEHQNRY
uniref:Neurobeachin a n=1 Tax=Astyanax mexicanus TaxID=7994 RepID=A0A8B9H1U9_ASTMX